MGILAFYPFKKKKIGNMPQFQNSILSKSSYARSNLKKKNKKKSMELEFRELEFQNATIGLLEPDMG